MGWGQWFVISFYRTNWFHLEFNGQRSTPNIWTYHIYSPLERPWVESRCCRGYFIVLLVPVNSLIIRNSTHPLPAFSFAPLFTIWFSGDWLPTLHYMLFGYAQLRYVADQLLESISSSSSRDPYVYLSSAITYRDAFRGFSQAYATVWIVHPNAERVTEVRAVWRKWENACILCTKDILHSVWCALSVLLKYHECLNTIKYYAMFYSCL